MSSLRTFVSAFGLAGLGGFGYWMWCLIVPGENRRKELLKVMRISQTTRFLPVPTSGLSENIRLLLILQKRHVFLWRSEF